MDKINRNVIQKKLDYLNLDLDDIPNHLIDFQPLNFNVSRLSNDKDHRIFRYVPIDKIDILITPCLRTDPLKDKYGKAMPLIKYVLPADNEEDLERYTEFLRMIDNVNISEIENVAMLQKEMEKKEPFKVKFPSNNMWQIYYSPDTDRYFMLACSRENTYAELFYLIKAKIDFMNSKARIAPKVFVPINAMNYTEEFLNRTELADLENYLWLFTKNWALIFEVFSKLNSLSLQITGETIVYDNVKSSYKVKITKREDAVKFYKLLKALFILQTEIKNHYNFTTRIDSNNGLEFYFENRRITYDMLTDFIRDEYDATRDRISDENDEILHMNEQINELADRVKELEDEYLIKQKEISTYLEYKKTFFGKMKYFFKSSKINKKISSDAKKDNKDDEEDLSENRKIVSIDLLKDKKYYTIEDLVEVFAMFEKAERRHKDLKQDYKAMKLKYENLVSKVKNANLYIEEIDKHKKSIFDFWKFSNKDEKLSLEMGSEEDEERTKRDLKKSFDLESEFENLGAKVDTIQRKKLSREETDGLFIAKNGMLKFINMLRNNDLDKDLLEDTLDELKLEYNKNRLHSDDDTFDIFGSVTDDARHLKYIGSRGHRENEKNKFKILNVNKKIDVFDFTEKLQSTITYLEGATPKLTAEYDFSLYKVCQITENIDEKSFDIFDINVENALEEYKDDGEGALNLIKLNYKEGLPLLYYSNIVFYDNQNQTLPIGMELSSSVFLDCRKLQFKLVNKTKFRTNNYFTESNNLVLPKTKDVFVYEYDVDFKDQKDVKESDVDEKDIEDTEE